ncbi:MAG: DUF1778 domain-containing protein [Planctomycetota bacterium]|nr:DUF1778 domain-containing protein [Planctomycetota bacterium]
MAKSDKQSPAMVRIDARIPSHVKEIVIQAASLQGRSQTDFMIAVLGEAARKVIADNAVIRLCLADQKALAAFLLDDRRPSAGKLSRLRRACREHSKRLVSELARRPFALNPWGRSMTGRVSNAAMMRLTAI